MTGAMYLPSPSAIPKLCPFGARLKTFFPILSSSMATTTGANRSDHLSLTADSFRQDAISLATISQIQDLSPTVKKLTLDSRHLAEVAFKAGQWVDFFIPSIATVGGFSMCSAPETLKEKGLLELAIKYSSHPPAHWVHTQCKPGAVVGIKVGGDFFFDPAQFYAASAPADFAEVSTNPSHNSQHDSLLLIAGGVGINPLVSILEELSFFLNDNQKRGDTNADQSRRCLLLYSAAREEELLFKDKIDSIADSTAGIDVRYFVTRERESSSPSSISSTTTSTSTHPSTSNFNRRRIDLDYLRNQVFSGLSPLTVDRCLTYVCGPPSMIDDSVRTLTELGVDSKNVVYEKWW